MEAQVRLGLRERASFADVRRVFGEIGSIGDVQSGSFTVDWSPITRANHLPGESRETVSRSRAYVNLAELPGQVLWEIDDGTLTQGADAVRSIANFIRLIAVCERFVEEGLSHWWIAGLNRSTGVPHPADATSFEHAAAFRNDDIATPPGFIALNGVRIAIGGLLRLPIVARAAPPAADAVTLADVLTTVIAERLTVLDDASARVRADVSLKIGPFLDWYANDRRARGLEPTEDEPGPG